MSSVICVNLDQSKILLYGNGLNGFVIRGWNFLKNKEQNMAHHEI